MSCATETLIQLGAEAGEEDPLERDRVKEAAQVEIEIWHTGVVIFHLREACYTGVGERVRAELTKHDALQIIHTLQACVDSGQVL